MSITKIWGKRAFSDSTLGWLVRFWALAAFFYWLDHSSWFKALVVAPYARLSASVTAHLLTLLGVGFQIQGTSLTVSGKVFVVADSCTGSFVFLLLAAVIIAFPASWKEKLIGLAAGLFTVVFLNLFRTLMIVLVAARFSGSFWGLHIIVGQALIIAGTLAVFVWWAQGVGRGRSVLPINSRRLFMGVVLYVLGFLFSYGLYTLFLNSPAGTWFKDLVIRHAAVVLGLFTETTQQGQVINTARNSIRVIHDCLSSPVLVLFLAAFFILPLSWPRRLLLYGACFFPLYYFYHVGRTVVAIWFMAGGRDANFAYNFFGQVALVKALLLFSVYYWAGQRKVAAIGRQLILLLVLLIPAAALVLLVGWFWQDCGLPFLASFAGASEELYDPGRIVSLMPLFHTFAWLLLVMTTPLWSWKQRGGWALAGGLGLNLFFALLVIVLLVLGLAPHPWLIKSINVALPFVVYFGVVSRIPDP
ncbi:MAG: archaeosortase/exosortase family protein [Pseudomonadota bacterium]|nr:archaeosortase/exosortase family protein [Pseudomonadota bacterium]